MVFSTNTDFGILSQNHNSIVRFTQTDFIFRTNHSLRNLAPDFRFLNFKWLTFQRINRCSNGSNYNFLPGAHIWCTANNLKIFFAAHIYRSYT